MPHGARIQNGGRDTHWCWGLNSREEKPTLHLSLFLWKILTPLEKAEAEVGRGPLDGDLSAWHEVVCRKQVSVAATYDFLNQQTTALPMG